MSKETERHERYIAANQKRVPLRFKNEYYNDVLLPAAKLAGLPVATYIKQAVAEKIERDKEVSQPLSETGE